MGPDPATIFGAIEYSDARDDADDLLREAANVVLP